MLYRQCLLLAGDEELMSRIVAAVHHHRPVHTRVAAEFDVPSCRYPTLIPNVILNRRQALCLTPPRIWMK